MKKSIASLKERLPDWTDWDGALYELGACLGFWPDFGAPPGEDQWNGVKGIIWSTNPLNTALVNCLNGFVIAGLLEENFTGQYRWNPNYKEADHE